MTNSVNFINNIVYIGDCFFCRLLNHNVWTWTMGRDIKANAHVCGQGKGQILLNLCGCHKWMRPYACCANCVSEGVSVKPIEATSFSCYGLCHRVLPIAEVMRT